jgi:cathepsin D
MFSAACETDVEVSFSFRGTLWPISPADVNLGTLGNDQCLGAIFELSSPV